MQVCKVQKDFGEAKSKILHVFDPKVEAEDGQPASSLAQYLEKQLGELLPMLGVKPVQVSSSPYTSCHSIWDHCSSELAGVMAPVLQDLFYPCAYSPWWQPFSDLRRHACMDQHYLSIYS